MKLRLHIDEVIRSVAIDLEEHDVAPGHHLHNPRWLKDHGPHDGGVGNAYDVPDYLEFDVIEEEISNANQSA